MAPSCTQTAKGSRRSPCRAKASTGWVPASIPPLDSRTMDASCLFCPSSLIRHAGSRLGSPCSSPRSDPFRPACLISDPWPRRDKGTKEKRAVLVSKMRSGGWESFHQDDEQARQLRVPARSSAAEPCEQRHMQHGLQVPGPFGADPPRALAPGWLPNISARPLAQAGRGSAISGPLA